MRRLTAFVRTLTREYIACKRGANGMERKTLGLALGAGGSRGIAHVGFLRALEEAGIKPDYIVGCSMGSVVGAAYASGMGIDEIEKAVLKLRLRHILAPTLKRGGLCATRKMRKVILKYVGDVDFEDLKIPFRCVAVDMLSQTTVTLSKGKVVDSVVASSSIPAVFKPTEREGMRLIDGGVLTRVPYREVKEMGADVVVAVDVLGRLQTKKERVGTLGVLLQSLDIMDNHRTERAKIDGKDSIDFWLEPDLEDMSQYALKRIDFALKKGYELGKRYAEEIKKKLST